ncbi:MarR family winged helix-turn-helix transcriptional regulator [Lysinibacillus sp. NPDC093190]|uniref:MarR family winged helix-turn-helix transcriptional regulator n=1 Tax=Lysinibacillus sp. NPDC093190 TaxID=3390575 RepID=UPI003D02A8FC
MLFIDNILSMNQELFLMQQIYSALFSLGNKIQVQSDQYLEKLTSRQFMAILAIAHLPEDQTSFNNIARKLGTTKQNVKQLVTTMKNKGYVEIAPSEHDKRAVNTKITEFGKQVTLEAGEKGVYFLADLFKDFSTNELETMWGLLKKLYSFDGEEQDGFEEHSNLTMDENQNDVQLYVLKEFERRRNHKKGE